MVFVCNYRIMDSMQDSNKMVSRGMRVSVIPPVLGRHMKASGLLSIAIGRQGNEAWLAKCNVMQWQCRPSQMEKWAERNPAGAAIHILHSSAVGKFTNKKPGGQLS